MDTSRRRIIIDQSNAKIEVSRVDNLNASQIGGTINNGKAEADLTASNPSQTPQKSYGIGVVFNWLNRR